MWVLFVVPGVLAALGCLATGHIGGALGIAGFWAAAYAFTAWTLHSR